MNEFLQRLLDLIAGKDGQAKPEDMTAWFKEFDRATLSTMDDAALEAFTELRKGEVNDDVTAQLRTLADASTLIRAEDTRRQEIATARAAEVDELATRMARPPKGDDPDSAPAEPQPADPAAPPAEPQPGEPGAPPPADAPPSTPAPAPAPAPEPQPALVASPPRSPVSLSAIRARQPQGSGRVSADKTPADDGRDYVTTLVAGADIPTVAPGAEITDIAGLAEAWQGTFSRFPVGTEGVGSISRTVAILRRTSETLTAGVDPKSDYKMIEDLCDETRLPGGSLLQAMLAGAGWCTPSDQDFTLCPPLEGDDGYMDVAQFIVNHGGIKWPKFQPWQELYAAVPEQILCEVDLIADTPKVCVTATCPTWLEQRLCAAPFCVISDIPMETAWPQLMDQFATRALRARRRRLNAYTIARIAALATPVSGLDILGSSHSVYDSLNLIVAWYKDLNKMPDGATLEAVAPRWLRSHLKADLAKRDAVGVEAVTNQDVLTHFANVETRPQFVYDWQSIAPGAGGPPQTFTPPTAWPSTVDILLYPAGTFAKGVKPMVNINAVYDSTMLKTNKYMKTFFEDAFLITQRCHQAMRITIPLCASGLMGARVDACTP